MKKSKGTSIASFICGLTFWIPLINLLFGVLAIVLGIKSINKIITDPQKYEGKGYAIIGIMLGTISIYSFVIGIVVCLLGYSETCKVLGLSFLGK